MCYPTCQAETRREVNAYSSIHGWSIASASAYHYACMHAYIVMNHIDATIDITHRIVPGTRVVGMLVVGTVIS